VKCGCPPIGLKGEHHALKATWFMGLKMTRQEEIKLWKKELADSKLNGEPTSEIRDILNGLKE
jgi:hypothetical protein